MGEKNEKLQRIKVRDKLRGSATFKRWVLRFIGWVQEGPIYGITVDIDRMRNELMEVYE
jgi:hypothetical protein